MTEKEMDDKLIKWATKKIKAKMKKNREKNRSGWHDHNKFDNYHLIHSAYHHADRKLQFLDAAILFLMAEYRMEHDPEKK